MFITPAVYMHHESPLSVGQSLVAAYTPSTRDKHACAVDDTAAHSLKEAPHRRYFNARVHMRNNPSQRIVIMC